MENLFARAPVKRKAQGIASSSNGGGGATGKVARKAVGIQYSK